MTLENTDAVGKSAADRSVGRRADARFEGRRWKFLRLFRNSWIHLILLVCVFLFMFPFFWMLATSVKTDEELLSPAIMPEVLGFRGSSPYVRKPTVPDKPLDVPPAEWEKMLPTLTDIATASIVKYELTHPSIPAIKPVDPESHRESAASLLVGRSVAKMNRRFWTGSRAELLGAYRALLTDSSVATALSDSLGKLRLLSFQLRTLDLHMYDLTDGSDFASTWRVESGPGKLFANGDGTLVSYNYKTSWSKPVVLRYDFRLPPGVTPAEIYQLNVTIGADNSWHRVYATLDTGGNRWITKTPVYIAQNRPMSLLFQPPTFDDTTMRAKLWTSLIKTGPTPKTQKFAPQDLNSGSKIGVASTLRLTIYPSSAIRANWGKLLRNYDLAFRSVPFWTYIINSVLLVALCTGGALFSASFVAYAFARLRWPGRSAAFLLLLATMMLPSQVTMIPGFLIWRELHWYNTLNPIWVPAFFGSAFFIFLMVQHMRSIPRELEEAARLDGLNSVQSWYYMILPQVTPTLAAIGILSFMASWNEFMAPLIYLRDQTKFPLSLGLYGLGLMRTTGAGADYNWAVVMAGNMLMTIPVIIVFFVFQRYFVQGMTLTGMKG